MSERFILGEFGAKPVRPRCGFYIRQRRGRHPTFLHFVVGADGRALPRFGELPTPEVLRNAQLFTDRRFCGKRPA